VIVRMWEAKVAPGRLEDAVDYLVEEIGPDALAAPGCLGAEAFQVVGEERVVLLTRWEDEHAEDWEEAWPPVRLWTGDRARYLEPVTRTEPEPN
jgi:quinol monooxygenase YgiN